MSDDASRSREDRVADLLEHCVLTEIRAVDAGLHLGLNDQARAALASSITSEVLYAFRVDWDPDWVKDGELHAWIDDTGAYARCPVCLVDSPATTDRGTARRWVREHVQSEHQP